MTTARKPGRDRSLPRQPGAAAVCYPHLIDFEPSSLIASLVVSSIVFVVFVYGKRQHACHRSWWGWR